MDQVLVAKTTGVSPPPDALDVLFDFLIDENGAISTIYAHHTESDMNVALVQPWCSIGSDGLALATRECSDVVIPIPAASAHFPRILGEYVRNRESFNARRRRAQNDVTQCRQGRPARPRLAQAGPISPTSSSSIPRR